MDQKRFAFFQQVSQRQMNNLPSGREGTEDAYIETNNLLRRMLSASNIQHTMTKSSIKSLAFGFKKLQFHWKGRMKHCSSKQPLFLKDLDESISEIRKDPLRRDHSLLFARPPKTAHLSKGKDQRKYSLQGGNWSQKAQLLDEIIGRLQGSNAVNCAQEGETRQYCEFGTRIANLQSFMKKIKKERAHNEQPAVIIQRTIVPRVNSHKLLLTLELERKRAGEDKGKLMFQALQKVRSELQKVKQSQQRLLSIPSQSLANYPPEKTQVRVSPTVVDAEQGSFFDKTVLEGERRVGTREKDTSQAIFSTSNRRFTFSFQKQR